MTIATEVQIAGVPWPVYKLLALAIGALVLVVVGLITTSLAPAVLAGSAAAAVTWLALSIVGSRAA
ncbi:hypothetical protein MMAD_26730 [Mycolicibacterium madagascariense]|uniref:Uncharacterized protein n=1 Tax=Mycolicibacterium madagascariense TaxID=212765 RepID=A0A7I7XGP8_9MYCO|nr:hypothetical protein [Mycolicibacterium madagascariense]MCV7013326.1 hypothetical protein [Mycolicibacterium madagascariense]BBZ28378.1 hypothetical protein MMAD_26730 [Mycolicibacterium madagascariense]